MEGLVVERFSEDVNRYEALIGEDMDSSDRRELRKLRDKLEELYRMNRVKINHSIMELLLAKHLILQGYEVDVERVLGEALICDVNAKKGDGVLIVEIETGCVPPDHALDPSTYTRARIASKIARFSILSDKFGLASPPYYILPIPSTFIKPPRDRGLEELEDVKTLCDRYYHRPPIKLEEIRTARLHVIYVIDVDNAHVHEMDSERYLEIYTQNLLYR